MANTLDPDDWDEFRDLAHAMLDKILDEQIGLQHRRTWNEPPEQIKFKIDSEPMPTKGSGEAATFEDFCELVLPYSNGSWHPRFFGWVQGTGVPFGALADLLASSLNAHLAGFNQTPKHVELTVIRWLCEWLGYPASASGLLVSGGSMANTLALAVAKEKRIEDDTKYASLEKFRIYASSETHGWLVKSARFLSLPLCLIDCDSNGQVCVEKLERQIDSDRKSGLVPMAVIGNAGTVRSGAFDDLAALAELCKREDVWFHVDGAFGIFAAVVESHASLVAGFEKADSIAFDLHKWMYLPFEIGCLLVADADDHTAAFSKQFDYMQPVTEGLLAGGVPLADRGIELTRGFKALKAWMCMKAYGVERFSAAISKNIEQANQMAELIRTDENLILLEPVCLNVVCFRFEHDAIAGDQLDEFNSAICVELQKSGDAVLSTTVTQQGVALRAAITNHRTQAQDIETTISAVKRIAADLLE